MSETDRDGFLNRWSERKHRQSAVQTPDAIDDRAPPAQARTPDAADVPSPSEGIASPSMAMDGDDPIDDGAAAPPPCDADMPPVESLDGASDVSAFFSDGVSAALRRAALRQVFSAARFNVRDGLNDYDGDYTVFEPLGDTVTADMKFHAARRERLAREAAEQEEAERLASRRNETDGVDDEAVVEAGQEGEGDVDSEGEGDRHVDHAAEGEVPAVDEHRADEEGRDAAAPDVAALPVTPA